MGFDFDALCDLTEYDIDKRVETCLNEIAQWRAELDVLHLLKKHIQSLPSKIKKEGDIQSAINRINGREGGVPHVVEARTLGDPLAWLDEPSGGELWYLRKNSNLAAAGVPPHLERGVLNGTAHRTDEDGD